MALWALGAEGEGVYIRTEDQSFGDIHTCLQS